MSEATIRAALYSAVGGVTSVGKVYDYERWANEWPDFLTLFKTTISGTTQIRGWEVAYRGQLASANPGFGKLSLRQHRFEVHGYMGVDDSAATEKTFAALAEDICDAIDDSTTLQSSTYRDSAPATIERLEPRFFGGVLCHYAQIVALVTEEV